MCGIFGMFATDGAPLRHPELLERMGEALRHRGPDGVRRLEGRNVALGCCRLRIVDLRPEADQPFADDATGNWLACNGEIYNQAELRRRFDDYPFTTRCDVEVGLPLYAADGAGGLGALEGMFGLAIWDAGEDALLLARDRAGEKPLFYTFVGRELWFASEMQALLVGGVVPAELDEEALHAYLTLGYTIEPRTLFRGVRKIPAGAAVVFHGSETTTHRYWQPAGIAARDRRPLERGELRETLERTVSAQMMADVPVGVFLSGGLDSALLATLASKESEGRLHTFNARFAEASYDESRWAVECAKRIGARHHEVRVDDESLLEAFDEVTERIAEPVPDPALLPTFLVAREARRHVTVALSGEGADELFGGYPTYPGHRLASTLGWASPLLGPLRWCLDTLPESRRKVPVRFLLTRFLDELGQPRLERHARWFGVGAQSTGRFTGAPAHPFPEELVADLPQGLLGIQLLDYATYLREGLLVKIDRSTMLSSLESRAPFLDRRLSELAWRSRSRDRVRGLETKSRLKEAALAWLPRATVYRRKRGLSVPIASLLDGALAAEVDRLLEPGRLSRQEILRPDAVTELLCEHRSGRRNHARPLWTLVTMQRWLDRWMPARGTP